MNIRMKEKDSIVFVKEEDEIQTSTKFD